MIQKNLGEVESDWQKELATAFKNPKALLDYLRIPAEDYLAHAHATKLFPMMVPRFFASLMQKGNPNDPLLQQVLPKRYEFDNYPDFITDPLHEQSGNTPGLLHKYKNRLLLIVRGGCAVNCRYCFRRHFPYKDNQLNKAELRNTLDYIDSKKEIDEVIFSGGDPLMAADRQLGWLTSELEKIPHIKRLRIHTRLPIVIPNRINDNLCAWLKLERLQKTMVLHINHTNEISDSLRQAVDRLAGLKVRVYNQAVLLAGINDSIKAQILLNQSLFDAGIQPYYLHLPDKVKGTAHFDVPESKAKEIMLGVMAAQSGYMIPKLVKEVPGEASKTSINLY